MLQVSVHITGSKETQRRLTKLGPELHNVRSAMKSIGKGLETYYSGQAWQSQGGVFKNRWKPLSPITILARGQNTDGLIFETAADANFAGFLLNRRLQSGAGGLVGSSSSSPLIDTGSMRESFYSKASKSSVLVSNKADYFKYHQSSATRKSLPRRQMMGINRHVRTMVRDMIQADIQKKLRTTR